MFSGKTSSLENDINRFDIAGYKTIAFKPAMDTRHSRPEIISHDNKSLKAVLISDILEIDEYCKKESPDIIAIDEVQFLGGRLEDIISSINKYLEKDITVVVSGLDMDFSGKAFEIVKELMPISDYLYKHHAVCVKCGNDGWVSHRKTEEQKRIVIGATNEYEPLCRKCFIKENKV